VEELRDSCTREVNRRRKAKSGNAASGRKQCIFFEELSFLQLVTTNKETSNNFQAARCEEELLRVQLRRINRWLMPVHEKGNRTDYFRNKNCTNHYHKALN
jgi:hypothetical protein